MAATFIASLVSIAVFLVIAAAKPGKSLFD